MSKLMRDQTYEFEVFVTHKVLLEGELVKAPTEEEAIKFYIEQIKLGNIGVEDLNINEIKPENCEVIVHKVEG